MRATSASRVGAEKSWLARSAVLGRDPGGGELLGERRAADEERDLDGRDAQVLRRHHHLLRGLHEQAGETECVGLVGVVRRDQILGRHLDAQVDHAVSVVREDDLDQVLADVVDIAFDGGQHDRTPRGRLGLFHEPLEVGDGGLHRLRRLEDFGDDELVVVEQPPDLVHAPHQRAIDDLERARLAELRVQVVDQAVAAALDDVARESLVE